MPFLSAATEQSLLLPAPTAIVFVRYFYNPLLFSSSQGRVERVTQSVTEQVEAKHQQADKDGGEKDHMRIGEQIGLSRRKQGTYARQITRIQADDSEIAEAGLRENNAGDNENAARDERTDGVGEDMLEHDASVFRAQGSRNQNVFLILEAIELHSGSSCHTRPTCDKEGYEQDHNV